MRLSGQEYVDMYASKAKDLDREKARQAAAEKSGDEPEQKAS